MVAVERAPSRSFSLVVVVAVVVVLNVVKLDAPAEAALRTLLKATFASDPAFTPTNDGGSVRPVYHLHASRLSRIGFSTLTMLVLSGPASWSDQTPPTTLRASHDVRQARSSQAGQRSIETRRTDEWWHRGRGLLQAAASHGTRPCLNHQ